MAQTGIGGKLETFILTAAPKPLNSRAKLWTISKTTERSQRFIAELKADRAATKEKEKSESWTKYVSLTVVIIAVVGSIAAQWSGAAFTGHASRSTQLASSSSAGMRYPTPQGSSFPSPQHKSIQGLAGTPNLKSLPAPARGGSPSIWNDGPSPLRV